MQPFDVTDMYTKQRQQEIARYRRKSDRAFYAGLAILSVIGIAILFAGTQINNEITLLEQQL